jgi:hypothetical protein
MREIRPFPAYLIGVLVGLALGSLIFGPAILKAYKCAQTGCEVRSGVQKGATK